MAGLAIITEACIDVKDPAFNAWWFRREGRLVGTAPVEGGRHHPADSPRSGFGAPEAPSDEATSEAFLRRLSQVVHPDLAGGGRTQRSRRARPPEETTA